MMTVPPALLAENVLKQLCRNKWMWPKRRYLCVKWLVTQQATRHYSNHIIKSPYKDVYIPKITLNEFMLNKIEKYADFPALVCGVRGKTYTYWQLQQCSRRFAVSLLKTGLKQGQALALVLANCPEFAVIVLGALEAGIRVSTVNHSYTAVELAHQLYTSGTVCVVTNPDNISTVLAAKSHIEESNKINFPLKIIAVDVTSESLPQGVGRYSELIDSKVDVSQLKSLKNCEIDNRDIAFLPFSSGTTGLSKGVQLSHRNIVSNIIQLDNPDVNFCIEPTKGFQDVVPGILPFFHIYGLNVVLLQSLYYGCKIVTMPKFDPELFENVLRKYKCTVMSLVPPIVIYMGNHKSITSEHLNSFRFIGSGAAPLGAGDVEKCLEKMTNRHQCTFLQGYGMTETSPITLSSSKNSKNLSSVGQLVASTKAKLVNYSTGETVGPNERGELCLKGPQIMLGYLKNPEATSATIDKDGWLHTGDISYYDENNYFYIVDRIKELIKVKGFQVPPAELEELLRLHPAVDDAGVVGIPDSRSGEVPVGYIVPVKNKQPSVEELKNYIASKVSPYKQLADIVFVDSIPKSPAGKILRRDMKAMYLESKH